MSYDLMVFDAAAAPRARKPFMNWFGEQTQWGESHGYNDPAIPTREVQAWFKAMIKQFPPLNGPLARDDDEYLEHPRLTDYSLGRSVICAAFPWPESENAREQVVDLAAKQAVGFFDVSDAKGGIWWPDGKGKLV